MQSAYGQIPQHTKAAEQRDFNIIVREATGSYRFTTGFYGLTKMPTELLKIMDSNLEGFSKTYTFIDDILVVPKGTETKHWEKNKKVIEKLDIMKTHLILDKCKIVEKYAEWLWFHFSQTD